MVEYFFQTLNMQGVLANNGLMIKIQMLLKKYELLLNTDQNIKNQWVSWFQHLNQPQGFK